MNSPGRNEKCPCGSGQKYKRCCGPLAENRRLRMASAEHARTLRQKNITLINAAGDIFGLQTRNWDSVKRKITPAQVREFYEVVARLWPPSTDLLSMLPPPDSTLRALYLGEYAPELILQNVCRFGLYADEIILINPFNNPNLMRDEYNPIVHPEEWMEDTLRTLFQLLAMAPWVDQGFVTFIPNPGEFDRDLLMKTVALAEERLKKNPITDEDVHDSIFREQTLKKFKSSPPDYLARIYREMDPDVSDDQVQDLVKHFEAERLADPFLTGQTMDKMPPQMLANRTGASLEMGLYICRAIGAFPYTNFRFRWKELLGAREQLDPTSEIWTPLTKAFQDLDFKFLDHVDSEFACTMRSEGRLGGFRAYLRKVWTSVSGSPDA